MADVAAGHVVLVVIQAAGAVDGSEDGWVVLSAVWDGDVKVVVAAGGGVS